MDQSIDTLKNQRESMQEMIEGTLDRKLNFLKYEKDRLSYKMDESLYFLLQKIQEIDKGPDPVSYMYSLQTENLVKPSDQVGQSLDLFNPNTPAEENKD